MSDQERLAQTYARLERQVLNDLLGDLDANLVAFADLAQRIEAHQLRTRPLTTEDVLELMAIDRRNMQNRIIDRSHWDSRGV